jgi:two-component system OmpR family response regulator
MKTMIEPSASTATKTRVLIVDDNRRFAEGARAILQRTGQYTVCVETNAPRALETARSFKPDLLLVDLMMPEIDGVELATQIGADWALHDVPIVFVTALITPEEASDLGQAAHCRRAFARSRGKPAVLCRGLTNKFFSKDESKKGSKMKL